MEYRHFGSLGLRVQALLLGSWVSFNNDVMERAEGILDNRHEPASGPRAC